MTSARSDRCLSCTLACLGVALLGAGAVPSSAASQPPTDLRAAHQSALRSTVVVSSPLGEGAG